MSNRAQTNVALPPQYQINARVHDSPIQQLRKPARTSSPAQITATHPGSTRSPVLTATFPDGETVTVLNKQRTLPADLTQILRTTSGEFPATQDEIDSLKAAWALPASTRDTRTADPTAVRKSWDGHFQFIEEELHPDKTVRRPGLRPPQVGAVYATLGHWTTCDDPATIVMPTGTGKTETMLALCLHQRPERLLVVVPNDALRDQIGEKFVTLGLLKQFGVIHADAQYPIVCRLKHIPKTAQQVTDLFSCSNVIVTTMPILSGCEDSILQRIVQTCSHLFIDEAHHVAAQTWERVKSAFSNKRIVQFTATPFREDAKHVPGTVVFNYPLRKAQDEGYFKPITFRPIWSFDPAAADEAIARQAIATLEEDLTAGFDHLVMARAASQAAADHLGDVYRRLAPQWSPVVIHSKRPADEQRESLAALHSRQARVVICVNMFGEGFDFPELKIAALHELHRSLAITLQFTGRFTRSKPRLGNATVIANLAEAQVQQALKGLYAEDADWNELLRDLSSGASGAHHRFSAFVRSFLAQPTKFALGNLTPKMSTVVYQASGDQPLAWKPDRIPEVIEPETMLEAPVINPGARLAVVITQTRSRVDWGAVRDLVDVTWDLYVIHHNASLGLLFIHSTVGSTLHKELATAVGGRVDLIRGEQVFRIFGGIQRMILTNLGLKDVLGRARRFTMHVGSDVLEAIRTSQTGRNKAKSNLFGYGYRDGNRVSAGASLKGKLWAHQVSDDLEGWMAWCQMTGEKLLDSTINIDALLNTAVKFETLNGRPNAVPIAMEWCSDVLANSMNTVRIRINDEGFSLHEISLTVLTDDDFSPIRVALAAETQSAVIRLDFDDGQVAYEVESGTLEIQAGRKQWTCDEWFQAMPPVMHFSDRVLMEDHLLARLSAPEAPFPQERIEVWNWAGTNLRRESQGHQRRPDTIQYKVVQTLLSDPQPYDIVFDDDDSGEAADVIAIRVSPVRIEVHFFHCKYSQKGNAGERVKDLYEVCGQTQKSVRWRDLSLTRLLQHMQHRETLRRRKGRSSRFEAGKGDLRQLKLIEGNVHLMEAKFFITIVQPGISRANSTADQLELLAATDLYLAETYQIPFRVIGSA